MTSTPVSHTNGSYGYAPIPSKEDVQKDSKNALKNIKNLYHLTNDAAKQVFKDEGITPIRLSEKTKSFIYLVVSLVLMLAAVPAFFANPALGFTLVGLAIVSYGLFLRTSNKNHIAEKQKEEIIECLDRIEHQVVTIQEALEKSYNSETKEVLKSHLSKLEKILKGVTFPLTPLSRRAQGIATKIADITQN